MQVKYDAQMQAFQEAHQQQLTKMRATVESAEARAVAASAAAASHEEKESEYAQRHLKTREVATAAESKARILSSQLEECPRG